jgi:WD40 repeat protein
MRRAVYILLVFSLAVSVAAEPVTTTPLQFYGLGTVTCGAWSRDGTKMVTAGSAGAFLWDDATRRVTRVFIGHAWYVTSVAISPDGTKIATGSADWEARLWNARDGTTLQVFSGHAGPVNSVAFSPENSKVLTGGDDGVAVLWSAADGSEITRFTGHAGPVLSVAFSPQITKVLTGSADGTAKLWNAATGALIRSFNCGSTVSCVAFSPDGNEILTGYGRTTRLWNVADGAQLWTRTWGNQIAEVSSLAFTREGTSVTIGARDGWVVFRRADNGTTTGFRLAGSGPIASISYSLDDGAFLVAVAAPDNVAKIWYTGGLPNDVIYRGHTSHVLAAAFSPDGLAVLTGSDDWTAKLWNTYDGTLIRTFSGHASGVIAVAFSPDGAGVLTGSRDQTAKLWDATFGTLIRTFSGHSGWVNGVAFSPDGTKVLTGSMDSTARLWNLSNGALTQTFSGHTDPVASVAFAPDGTKILTGSWDMTAKIWRVSDGAQLRTLSGHTNWLRSATFSPDGTTVLTGSDDRTAKLWNVTDGSVIRTFAGHADRVTGTAISPDASKILTGSYDTTARLWNVSDGSVIRTYFGHADGVYPVAFSPDGTSVLTASYDQTARLWPPDTDHLVGHMSPVTAITVAGDQATTIATAHDDNVARLWNGVNGALLQEFYGHVARINSVALSPNGAFLLTGGNDRTAKLWDVPGGYATWTYKGHEGPVNTVAFSADGTKYLTASSDGWALLWRTSDTTILNSFAHGEIIRAAAISRDGSRVLTGGADNTAKLWNASTGAEIHTFTGHTDEVRCVGFSYDGTKILTGSNDNTARLWNSNTFALLRTFTGHAAPVISVGFSPDGSAVVAASTVSVKFWNAANGTLLRTVSGHADSLAGAALSGDGTRLVTGSEDGTARLWPAFAATGAVTGVTGDRFILVAGGGNYVGNPIVSQTQALADRAFFTCLVRGYKRSEIRYLSAFNDWRTRDSNNDSLPDADAQATTQTFWSAIDTWSSGTARLFIYLVDHGSYNSQTGEWSFRLNATQYIKASDLDSHLDTLQTRTGCEVILIVDCCFSGGFVQRCKAPAGKRRVVISSTTPQNLAIYSPPAGAESFSFYFLSFAVLGNTLKDCFKWTQLSFATMGNPAGQAPWMDDNNDGQSNKSDGTLAARHVVGRYPAFGLNAPTILDVASTQSVYVRDPVVLWARLDAAVAAKEVWAVVISTRAGYAPGEPVTNLTRVNLAFNSTLNRWQATWSPRLEHSGLCTVTYFAVSEDLLGTRLVATPKSSGLRVLGPTSVRLPWSLFE